MNKELLQKAEDFAKKRLFAFMSQREVANPYTFKLGFDAGAKEILDNPELYGLVKKEKYDELEEYCESLKTQINSNVHEKTIETGAKVLSAQNDYYKKENKELKEKVTELEGVIAKLSQRVINESNY